MKASDRKFELAQVRQRKYWERGWENDIDRQQRVKTRWAHLVSILKEQIELKPDSKILDIGCGPCGIIGCFDTGERYGLDPLMDYYISHFDMLKEIKWIKGDGESLPFEHEYFDVIINTDTLDHVKAPEEVLREIRRALKKDGVLFLTVNTCNPLTKLIKSMHKRLGIGSPAELHTFTVKRIEQMLDRLGFRITSSWHDVIDLEVVTRVSNSKAARCKEYFKKASEIKREFGLIEGIKFTISFLTGGRSYQGDAVIIAVKHPE